MLELLEMLHKKYGDLPISQIIKELKSKNKIVNRYWIYKSLGGRIYISSNKEGWELKRCKNEKEAEEKIKELLKEDEENNKKGDLK